jgi:hypothetical protein
MVEHVSSDQEFLDEMDRIARLLRATAAAAYSLGVNEQDVAALCTAGVDDARDSFVASASQARAASLDAHPTGSPLVVPKLALVTDAGPGSSSFQFGRLHPAVSTAEERYRDAA